MPERDLSPSEARIIDDGVRAIFAITTVAGAVDAERLQRAFGLLLSEQPRLAATIVHDGQGYVLRDGPARAPGEYVVQSTLDTSIHTPLERARALTQLSISPDGERTEVALAIDHAIGDGRYLVAMNERLWTIYTGGDAAASKPAGAPALPMEVRLQDRFDPAEVAELIARLAEARPPSVLPTRPDPGPDTTRTAIAQLDVAATDAFFAVARAHAVSIHTLVCGALMTVLRTRFDPSTAPHTITCDSPVDLRARLHPPLPADVAGLCVGFATVSVSTRGDEDAVELARAIQPQMDAARASSFPEKFLLASAKLPGDIHSRTTMLVSNLGPLPAPPMPDDLELVDIQLLVTGTAPPPFFVVTTLRGRLRIALVYTEAHHEPERMRALMADIGRALRAVR
ncbi:phthiocerol/phthiodiolone dimycocerosyl transferase family protein [Pendulispora albinea]|uniref:Phthiocerol/phthiodiolone dimycocerosyl transferase n=1 Tax=Pendulispora albinea TaxID=2741071 RepID=A0ABZ2M2V4_9BACT